MNQEIELWRHFFARPLNELLAEGARLRTKSFGEMVELCAIINIRSGNCSMDCKFCAQSRHSSAQVPFYPLLDNAKLLEEVEKLFSFPLAHIGLVASGAALGGAEFERLLYFLEKLQPSSRGKLCLSLGRLHASQMRELKAAGLCRYHHNLETSREYYPHICSSQKWTERYETVIAALESGLEVCSGFLFGLGESWEQRISLALDLKAAGIKNIPMNFLDPVPGTSMGARMPLSLEETLRIIVLFRHILPKATLRVCGGRLKSLGMRQEQMFHAGANALMTGNFLTTRGNAMEADLEMIRQEGLKVI